MGTTPAVETVAGLRSIFMHLFRLTTHNSTWARDVRILYKMADYTHKLLHFITQRFSLTLSTAILTNNIIAYYNKIILYCMLQLLVSCP